MDILENECFSFVCRCGISWGILIKW
jgi:hypothetical protein